MPGALSQTVMVRKRTPIAQARVLRILTRFSGYTLLVLLAIAMLFPYYWMVASSVKGPRGFTANPYSLIPRTFSLESIAYVWNEGRIPMYLKNSFIYAIIVLAVQTFINSLAAYAFSRIRFPGRDLLFTLVLATLMLPYSVLLIPTYLIVWRLGLANTVPGVVVPGFASAYGIFMLRQFFLNIPSEFEDAARIDGAGAVRIYWQIILPLAQPALYDRTFAASLIATVPLILLFFAGQRYIVGGISLTGLKG